MEHLDQNQQKQAIEKISILGVNIQKILLDDLLNRIQNSIEAHEKITVAYANVHTINLTVDIPWFKEYLNRADMLYCDGFGLLLGARLLGTRLPERFTPPDWFPKLAALSAQNRYRIFFLGSRHEVVHVAAERLENQFPGLIPIQYHHGYFDRTSGSAENNIVLQQINKFRPEILVVGMGQPTQEKWLAENWEHLECQVALPVGAMFDYLAGVLPRAPLWMTDHGLEWLGRLLVEPARLGQRYLVGNPRFLWRVLKQRWNDRPR